MMFRLHRKVDDKYDTDIKNLARRFQRLDEATEYPEALLPENIAKILRPKAALSRAAHIRRLALGLAGCLAVAAAVSFTVLSLNTSGGAGHIGKSRQNITAKNYAQIKSAMSVFLGSAGTGTEGAQMTNGTAQSGSTAGFGPPSVKADGTVEADTVVSGGGYFYEISRVTDTASKVLVVDARDPANMKLCAKISFDNIFVDDMLLYNNTLIVFSSDGTDEEPKTIASYFDVTDKSSPRLIGSFAQDGNYYNDSASLNGGSVYLVTSLISYDSSVIPEAGENGAMHPLPAGNIYMPQGIRSADYTVVSRLDAADVSEPAETVACLGGSGAVYVSASSLYVAVSTQTKKPADYSGIDTDIIKFGISGGLVYEGNVLVPGVVSRAGNMYEDNGFLSVASTTYKAGLMPSAHKGKGIYNGQAIASPESSKSGLYLLDGKMKLTGSIENLASGEWITAAWFGGGRAYLITSTAAVGASVEELRVIDLADPAKPAVTGTAKLPALVNETVGPYSDGLLAVTGLHSTVNGGNGPSLALYDISDPQNPRLSAGYDFDGEGGIAGPYPQAYILDASKGIIGFPAEIDKIIKNGKYYKTSFEYDGFYVFGAGAKTGITLKGSVTQYNGSDETELQKEGLEIFEGKESGDVLYTFSQAKIVATSLNDFSKLGELKLNGEVS